MTAFANALSMSFPVGEKFFIEAVKSGSHHLPNTLENAEIKANIRSFVGQEATHSHLHGLFNRQLEKQGYRNILGSRSQRRIEKLRSALRRRQESPPYLHELALTCAVEHFTAILGHLVLSHAGQDGDWFRDADEPLRTLWHWHAAEEAEHKSIAYDLYLRLGGVSRMRLHWYRVFAAFFVFNLAWQILHNLWTDKSIYQVRTWQSACRLILGRHGLIRSCFVPMMLYLRDDFHPGHLGDDALAQAWLQSNRASWSTVGAKSFEATLDK